jgi:hypothetical protein
VLGKRRIFLPGFGELPGLRRGSRFFRLRLKPKLAGCGQGELVNLLGNRLRRAPALFGNPLNDIAYVFVERGGPGGEIRSSVGHMAQTYIAEGYEVFGINLAVGLGFAGGGAFELGLV